MYSVGKVDQVLVGCGCVFGCNDYYSTYVLLVSSVVGRNEGRARDGLNWFVVSGVGA